MNVLPELENKTERVGGVPFTVTKFSDAVDACMKVAENPHAKGVSVRLANSYCVALASRDRSYRNILVGEGVNYPDGTPVWMVMLLKSLLKNSPMPHRVRGPSFFTSCLDKSQHSDLSHYFIGGTSDSMPQMMQKIRQRFPGLKVAGWYSPPFAPADEALFDACATRIRASGAQVVWVGLGTPKQDFASAVLAETTQTMCIGVGAAFDFLAGTVREAPQIFRLTGTEWIFRLSAEPKRLWRRYLFGNCTFVAVVILEGLGDLRKRIRTIGWSFHA